MNILKFDSPVSQILIKMCDMLILSLLTLLCCIPIITIGAAQAGLYTSMKVMQDKEDDTSVYAAFFRGFKAGFGTITACWGVVTLLLVLVVWMGVSAYMLGSSLVPMIISGAVIIIFQSVLPAFHSRFGSTFKMQMRNTLFFIVAYPIQCILVGCLQALPLIVWFVNDMLGILDFVMLLGTWPIWVLFYPSIAASASYALLKKPFGTLIDEYNSTHGAKE